MESSFNNFVYGHSSSSLPQSVTSLPPYTPRPSPPRRRRRELTEHVVELSSDISNKRAKPWAVLRVHSKAPPGTLPTFVAGEKIVGSVVLDPSESKSRHISCVKVMVRGEISTGVMEVDRVTFLETSATLWSKETGNTGRDGLQWPFSITLPQEVLAPSGSENNLHAYSLPPTFMERKTRACIRYNLIVHISRSKFREDSNLQTAFIYVPATKSGPPSPLRQLAYQENSPLCPPHVDPQGWCTLPPARVYGKIFSNHLVEVTCKLSLAKPLSYTRGSVIPLSLTLSSMDPQALDLLSSRQALAVRLRRKVTFHNAQKFAEFNASWCAAPDGQWTEPAEDVGNAVWWQGDHSDEEGDGRQGGSMLSKRLEGEIILSKSLKPTCHISHFALDYSIIMLPFQTTSFVPSTTMQKFHNGPILEQRVEITTMFPDGPRPIAHSPPEYRVQACPSLPPSRASLTSGGR